MGNSEELIRKVEEFEQEQSNPKGKKKKVNVKYILNISLVLIVTAVAIVLTVSNNFWEVLGHLLNADWKWLLVTFGMMLAAVMIRALVLFCFARLYTRDYHFHQAIAVDHIGTFYNAVTPGASGGQVLQAYTYKKQGIPISSAVSMLAMYSIMFQIVLIIYGLLAFIIKYDTINSIGFIAFQIGENLTLKLPIWPLTIIGFLLNVGVILIVLLMGYWKGFHNFVMGPVISLGAKLHLVKNPDKSRENLRIQVENFKVELRRMFSNIPFTILVFILFFFYMTIKFSIPYFVGQSLHNQSTVSNFWDAVFLANYHQMVTGLIPIPGSAGASELFFFQLFMNGNTDASGVPIISAANSFFYVNPDWEDIIKTAQELYLSGKYETWDAAFQNARQEAAKSLTESLTRAALLTWRTITFIVPLLIAGFVTAFYHASPKKEAENMNLSHDTFIELQSSTLVERSQDLDTLLETNRLSREAIMKKLKAGREQKKTSPRRKKKVEVAPENKTQYDDLKIDDEDDM